MNMRTKCDMIYGNLNEAQMNLSTLFELLGIMQPPPAPEPKDPEEFGLLRDFTVVEKQANDIRMRTMRLVELFQSETTVDSAALGKREY